MAKHLSDKAKIHYRLIHYTEIRPVLYQIEISAKERNNVIELQEMSQDELNSLYALLKKYFEMIGGIDIN